MDTKETILQLDPKDILADSNLRFGLIPAEVEARKASIVDRGQIDTPVEVEAIEGAKKGQPHYRLTVGFYRHAAATALNTEGAGLTVPAIVRSPGDALSRLKRQLSENVDRKNLSPMDTAIAIKALLDAGVSRQDVRKAFARPGGRKGNQLAPVSNSFLNIHLAMLDLPKDIQNKIHDGRVGIGAAMELAKVDPDKRAAVLDRAEAIRLKELERDEKADEVAAKQEAKAGEAEAKLTEAAALVESTSTAKGEMAAKIEEIQQKLDEAKNITMADFEKLDADAKKAHAETIGALKTDLRGAEKAMKKINIDAANAERKLRLLTREDAPETPATEAPAKTAKGAAGKPKAKAVSGKDVQKAAKETGASKKHVPLNAGEMRQAIEALAKSKMPKAKAIGVAVMECIAGITTAGQMVTAIEVLTGERKTVKA